MPQLLTVSRAARVAGLSRGAVQRKIQAGELPTFEGLVNAEDLLRVFPKTDLAPDKEYDRVMRIQANAFGKRVVDRMLPDAEVLSARLTEVGQQLATAKLTLSHYRKVFQQLTEKVAALSSNGTEEAAIELQKWLVSALDRQQADVLPIEPLLLNDSLLSIMSAHIHVKPSGHEFFVEGRDNILEAALRAGLNLDYRCSNGNCGACKARVMSGETKKIRNHDFVISEAEKGQGYTLLCCHTAVTDLVIEAKEAGSASDIPRQQIPARAKRIEKLTDDIILLSLQTNRTQRMRFLAGQSTALKVGTLEAEYPMASCPCDDRNIQFYVRRQTDNAFSEHVFENLKRDDVVDIDGPTGSYMLDEESPRSIIFIAIDDGFAPINSLIEHAMALEVAEYMHLHWLVSPGNSHYRHNQCRAWADALDNFSYEAGTVSKNPREILGELFSSYDDLHEYNIYLAGPESIVGHGQKLLDARAFPAEQLFPRVVTG